MCEFSLDYQLDTESVKPDQDKIQCKIIRQVALCRGVYAVFRSQTVDHAVRAGEGGQ